MRALREIWRWTPSVLTNTIASFLTTKPRIGQRVSGWTGRVANSKGGGRAVQLLPDLVRHRSRSSLARSRSNCGCAHVAITTIRAPLSLALVIGLADWSATIRLRVEHQGAAVHVHQGLTLAPLHRLASVVVSRSAAFRRFHALILSLSKFGCRARPRWARLPSDALAVQHDEVVVDAGEQAAVALGAEVAVDRALRRQVLR